MAEDREILIRTPGATPNEQALVPLAGVKDFYARDTDPGAVGFGSVWKKTSDTPHTWWTRNAADDGWDAHANRDVNGITDENAKAYTTVLSAGIGTTDASVTAHSLGDGTALANVNALADGTDPEAAAHANLFATAGGDAQAWATANATTNGTGPAFAGPTAAASGSGDADATSFATSATGTATAGFSATRDGVSVGLLATAAAGGLSLVPTGLPTSDPGGGAIWLKAGDLHVGP